MNGSGSLVLRKGAVLAAVVAAALAFAVAIGFAAPVQAQAATQGDELAAGSVQTAATSKVRFVKSKELWAGDTYCMDMGFYINYEGDSPVVTKVTTSDSSVIAVKKLDKYKYLESWAAYPKKAGKATLSVTYKAGSKTKTISQTYTVKEFTDGIASMTLNGEAIPFPTSKAAETEIYYYGFKGTTATLQWETANGWEVESSSAYVYKPIGKSKDKNFEITSGKQFTINKGYDCRVYIDLYNESLDEYFSFAINIDRTLPYKLDKGVLFVKRPKTSSPVYEATCVHDSDIKIQSVTSSNPKVVKAIKGKLYYNIKLQPKKVGKATITVKYKAYGREYTTSAVYTVSKYPLKSVKYNGKAVNLKKASQGFAPAKYNSSSATVNVVAANGWKVKKIQYVNASGKRKVVKNGASISTADKRITPVAILLTKGKMKFTYQLIFNRSGYGIGGFY